jgi:hypothetical protein
LIRLVLGQSDFDGKLVAAAQQGRDLVPRHHTGYVLADIPAWRMRREKVQERSYIDGFGGTLRVDSLEKIELFPL